MSAATSDPLQAPQNLRRRKMDGFEGRVARDRLSSMLVLAALLHGILLLGVTFTSPGSSERPRGLEVLLVSEELPEARDNDDAVYIAQRSQEGSGNTQERRAAELPTTPQQPVAERREQQRRPSLLNDPLLTTSVPAMSTVRIEANPEPELLLSQQELEQLLASEAALVLRGEARENLYVSPDTRASRLAPYLDAWRRRVEQIGTERFRRLVAQQGNGSLLVEVVIQADGRLGRATIQRSSGTPQLDEAAREILRLASPFDPFPPELARDYRSLRFAYEWQFTGGRATSSGPRLP